MSSDKPPSQIAACDSMALMWAFPWAMTPEKKATKKRGQDVPSMRERAQWMLAELTEKKIDLYIPSVVFAELLCRVDPSKHARLTSEIATRFFCPPFDVRACALAAQLWQFERGLPGKSPGLPEDDRTARRLLKSDILIVASAKQAGATIFYSHEEKCRRLAKQAGMEPRDLPSHSGRLFPDPTPEDESEDWPS